MKPLTPEESERRVTLASRGDDDDGEPETENPVVGLQVVPGDAQSAPERTRYRFEGCGRGKKHPLRFFVIGASSQCHIRLQDERVSAVHCLVVQNFRSRRVYVYDSGSTNGLRVNGIKVHGSELDPGDTITVGNTNIYAFGNQDPESQILITAATVKQFIERALATLGSERAAADAIKIPRSTLRAWLRKDDEE